MPNPYFSHSGFPGVRRFGDSAGARAEFANIVLGFDKLPTLTGNAGKFAKINAGETAIDVSSVLTESGGAIAIAGALSVTGAVTLGDAAGDALTVNGNAVTWAGNPTHSGNHVWSGTAAFNGGVTLGDAAGDALTVNSSAVSVPNGLNFDANTLVIDATNNFVGVAIAAPLRTFHVRGSSQSLAKIWLEKTTSGETSVGQDSSGFELTAAGMNPTNKYTPAIKFGSTDSDLTTTNPKFGAVIVGEAMETYNADTSGGMSLAFFTQSNAPGTTGALTERFRVKHLGQCRFVPLAADPSAMEDGDVWFNSTAGKMRARVGGATVDLH